MSTLLEIKQATANLLNIEFSELTQNGQDLFLITANQVRKMAELANDFEFSRKTLRVTVNGVTGGNLGLAEDILGDTYEVKTVIEAGLLDDSGNLCPVEWTTTSESLTRQREDNRQAWPRYPTDNYSNETPWGGARFNFSGDQVVKWPRLSVTDTTDYLLYLEGYTFHEDWTAADLGSGVFTLSGTVSPDVTGDFTQVAPTILTGVNEIDFSNIYYLNTAWVLQTLTGDNWVNIRDNTSPVGTYTFNGGGGGSGSPVLTLSPSTSDVWTTHGQKYILWATLVQLNHLFRRWVARTEGNLPPPQQLADEGLQSLIAWDAYRFEGFRTHNR